MLGSKLVLIVLCTLLVVGCGGSGKGHEQDNFGVAELSDAKPYLPNAAYADVIANCIRAEETRDSCALTRLPIIGMETTSPGVSDIMARLVVSHEWMGRRFEALLNALPSDMLQLFKGVTAVVIDNDIRPAYYTARTGAIYLDPAFLWLTIEDKRTINPKADFRSEFADPLAFRSLSAYTTSSGRAFSLGNLQDDSERTLEDIILLMASLLVHELAHANDFIPPNSYGLIDKDLSVSQVINTLENQRISTQLSQSTPLTSQTMLALAGVMFRGDTPTPAQAALSPTEVGAEFEADLASDDYNYSTVFEDTAMLFEETMMKLWFDIDRTISFIDVLPETITGCSDYVVRWGERNRVGNVDIKQRAQLVVSQLLPNNNYDTALENMTSATSMQTDISWCDSLSASYPANKTGSQKSKVTEPPENIFIRPYL